MYFFKYYIHTSREKLRHTQEWSELGDLIGRFFSYRRKRTQSFFSSRNFARAIFVVPVRLSYIAIFRQIAELQKPGVIIKIDRIFYSPFVPLYISLMVSRAHYESTFRPTLCSLTRCPAHRRHCVTVTDRREKDDDGCSLTTAPSALNKSRSTFTLKTKFLRTTDN